MDERLAIDGGTPVRTGSFSGPSHDFGEDDVEAVAEVIRSGSIGKGARTFILSASGQPGTASSMPCR